MLMTPRRSLGIAVLGAFLFFSGLALLRWPLLASIYIISASVLLRRNTPGRQADVLILSVGFVLGVVALTLFLWQFFSAFLEFRNLFSVKIILVYGFLYSALAISLLFCLRRPQGREFLSRQGLVSLNLASLFLCICGCCCVVVAFNFFVVASSPGYDVLITRFLETLLFLLGSFFVICAFLLNPRIYS